MTGIFVGVTSLSLYIILRDIYIYIIIYIYIVCVCIYIYIYTCIYTYKAPFGIVHCHNLGVYQVFRQVAQVRNLSGLHNWQCRTFAIFFCWVHQLDWWFSMTSSKLPFQWGYSNLPATCFGRVFWVVGWWTVRLGKWLFSLPEWRWRIIIQLGFLPVWSLTCLRWRESSVNV